MIKGWPATFNHAAGSTHAEPASLLKLEPHSQGALLKRCRWRFNSTSRSHRVFVRLVRPFGRASLITGQSHSSTTRFRWRFHIVLAGKACRRITAALQFPRTVRIYHWRAARPVSSAMAHKRQGGLTGGAAGPATRAVLASGINFLENWATGAGGGKGAKAHHAAGRCGYRSNCGNQRRVTARPCKTLDEVGR